MVHTLIGACFQLIYPWYINWGGTLSGKLRYVKITDIHTHKTRQAQNVVHFRPRVKKNIRVELICHRGCKLWEEIDKSKKDLTWYSFKTWYKKILIKSYMTSVGCQYFERCKFHVRPIFLSTFDPTIELP